MEETSTPQSTATVSTTEPLELTTGDVTPGGRKVRDAVLVISVLAVIAFGGASYMYYPQYEVGASASFYLLSNVVSFLLGMKSALTKPTSSG